MFDLFFMFEFFYTKLILSIDIENNNNLYLTDAVRGIIEVCDYYRFNRRVINRSNMNPISGRHLYKVSKGCYTA